MAEESIKILLTPEINTEPDKGNSSRNSTGIVKRNSNGISSSPNYLRASTGSCHDFCKYGREHAFEGKVSHPIPKRMTPPYSKQKNTGTVVLAERKRTSVKLKPSSDLKIHSPEQNIGNVVLPERKKTSVIKLKYSPALKIHSPEQNIGNLVLAERKIKSVVKVKPSPDVIHSPEPPEIIKREILLPSIKIEVCSKQNSLNTRIMKDNETKMTLYSKSSPAAKSKPVTVRPSSSSAASVVLNVTRKSAIKPGKITGTSNGKIMGTSNAKITGTSNGKITGTSNGKITGTSKAAVKKVLSPPTASFSSKPSGGRVASLYARNYRSLKLVSPQKDQYWTQKAESKKPNYEKVQEKTVHVLEAETEKFFLESVQSDGIVQTSPSPLLQSPMSLSHPDSQFLSSHGDDQEESEYTDSEDLEDFEYTDSEADEFISENDELVNINEVETLKGNHNQTPRKGGVILSEDKDCALAKAKFRRGKVIDLQSENNTPRRLRFRRGRVLGDNEDNKSYTRRRSFKKKREVDNDANGASPSSEKVVLRHQDMQGKKDAQGLFNNVIEETASILVESRKSKVKALVGAFETVISLQES